MVKAEPHQRQTHSHTPHRHHLPPHSVMNSSGWNVAFELKVNKTLPTVGWQEIVRWILRQSPFSLVQKFTLLFFSCSIRNQNHNGFYDNGIWRSETTVCVVWTPYTMGYCRCCHWIASLSDSVAHAVAAAFVHYFQTIKKGKFNYCSIIVFVFIYFTFYFHNSISAYFDFCPTHGQEPKANSSLSNKFQSSLHYYYLSVHISLHVPRLPVLLQFTIRYVVCQLISNPSISLPLSFTNKLRNIRVLLLLPCCDTPISISLSCHGLGETLLAVNSSIWNGA